MGVQELLVYWRVIKRRWWIIAALVGVTVGVILLSSFLSPPLYTASVFFQITSPPPASVSLFDEFKTSTTRDELNYTRNNFMAVLKSPYVANLVVDDLGLRINAQEIVNQTVIEPDTASDSVKVSVTANDPQLSADVAFALVNKASQYYSELNADSMTVNKEFIQAQLQETKKELDQARAALIDFQMKNNIGSPNGFLKTQEDLITALKVNRDKALAEGSQAVAASYESIIAAREQELQKQITLSSQYDDLQSAVDRIHSTYSSLVDKEAEANLKENEIVNAKFIQVIPAGGPGRPLPRINPTILLLGIVVSLAVGIVLAFLLQYLEGVGREGLSPERPHTRSQLADAGGLEVGRPSESQ